MVKIRKYVAVDDIGKVVNPTIVEGQVHGGLAQGIAQALFEEAVYDADGNLVTGTMVDYTIPSASDLPHFDLDRTETPSTSNPLGVKGVGEAGTIASTPAVVNAVVDALRPYGVQDVLMPCTPERVWRAIQDAGASGGGDRAAAGTVAYGGSARSDIADVQAAPRRRRPMIPAEFDYVKADLGRRGGRGARRARRRGQAARRWAEPAAAAPAAAVLPDGRRRRLQGRRDARRPRGRRPHRHRLHDHARRGAARPAGGRQHLPLLSETTQTVADPAVRHKGTFGGALAHADPAGDLAAVAVALDATMTIAGPERATAGVGGRLLRRLPAERARTGRGAGRGLDAEARRGLGRPLREVPPRRPGLGHRRRRRGGEALQRLDRGGADRADQHGVDAGPGPGDRAGARRCRRRGRGDPLGRGSKADEGTEPPEDLNGQGRLPPAPGAGAHRPRRDQGGGALSESRSRPDAPCSPPEVGSPADLGRLLRETGYLADTGVATACYLALALQRPLFCEGEAGVGKTSLARSLATALGAPLIRLQCYEGIDASQALYDWDFPRQLMHLRARRGGRPGRATPVDSELLENELYSRRFLVSRPLLAALETTPCVLLVDEVDRADDEFEAFLLEVLSDFTVTIPELGTVHAEVPPAVVLTSNRTRDVHDALKRRCLYHWLDHPSFEREVAIVRSRLPQVTEQLAEQVTAVVQRLRSRAAAEAARRRRDPGLDRGAARARRRPGGARDGDADARLAAQVPRGPAAGGPGRRGRPGHAGGRRWLSAVAEPGRPATPYGDRRRAGRAGAHAAGGRRRSGAGPGARVRRRADPPRSPAGATTSTGPAG